MAATRAPPRKDRPITTAMKDRIAAFLVLAALAGCQARPTAPIGSVAAPPAERSAESLYRAPPEVVAAAVESGGRLCLEGRAAPGDRVRLASPGGQAFYADAGRDGVWKLTLTDTAEPRLYGLAMMDHGRLVQSQGYVALLPGGGGALLRAGAGARPLDMAAAGPAILAVDFDSKGGAVVSGVAGARAALQLWLDGARRLNGRAGSDGAFSLALNEPLTFTTHRFEVIDGAHHADLAVAFSPAGALTAGPYRAAPMGGGWRIDWITPGGGLQTTLLLTRPGAAA